MTLEQYMRELWLMDRQYGQEEELYPLVNMLLREGGNTENLSIRDVHNGEKAENVKGRNSLKGYVGFPDLVILGEDFPGDKKNLKYLYGCVEIKKINDKLIDIDTEVNRTDSSHVKKEKPIYKLEKIGNKITIKGYTKQIGELDKNNGDLIKYKGEEPKITDLGQLLGELLWYGKVLYTNGVKWKYIDVKKCSCDEREALQKACNAKPTQWLELLAEKFKENNLTIEIEEETIGDLTNTYQKIKNMEANNSKNLFENLDEKDYEDWTKFKSKLAHINWQEKVLDSDEQKDL